jgi:hypothetical protein
MNFTTFRQSVGGHAAASILRLDIDGVTSWTVFREAALANRQSFATAVEPDGRAAFVQAVTDRFGTASTGERALIVAILYAIDYREFGEKLALEIDGRSFLSLLELTSGNHLTAALACLARQD